MTSLLPALNLRNCRIADAKFGEIFLADDGEKFIIGRAGDDQVVAVMLEGDFGKHKQFYFAPLKEWTRRGTAVAASLAVDPTSLSRPDKVPPGSVSLDEGTIHIAAYSGQSYQPVAITGDGRAPTSEAVAFTKWAATVEGVDGEPVELYVQGSGNPAAVVPLGGV